MAFQGLRRGIIAIGHLNDPSLPTFIEEEKDIVTTLSRASKEFNETSSYMMKWGEKEHFDLKDMTSNFGAFTVSIGKAFLELSESHSNYRSKLKDIKKKQDELTEIQKKHKTLADKLKSAKSNGKPFDMLEREVTDTNTQLLRVSAGFEASKRSILKEAMLHQYNGWSEFAAKISTIAHFGKYMANQIPQGIVAPGDELPPYTGSNTTKQIKDDCMAALVNAGSETISRPNSSLSTTSNTLQPAQVNANSKSPRPLPVNASIGSDISRLPTLAENVQKSLPRNPSISSIQYQQGPVSNNPIQQGPITANGYQQNPMMANAYQQSPTIANGFHQSSTTTTPYQQSVPGYVSSPMSHQYQQYPAGYGSDYSSANNVNMPGSFEPSEVYTQAVPPSRYQSLGEESFPQFPVGNMISDPQYHSSSPPKENGDMYSMLPNRRDSPVKSYAPELPIRQNSSHPYTDTVSASDELTECAFCKSIVRYAHIKDHLDNQCQTHIVRKSSIYSNAVGNI